MYYSYNNQYPIKDLPSRIRLSSGLTRTDSSTFTEEELKDSGWKIVQEPPAYNPKESKLTWNERTSAWEIIDLTLEEKSDLIRSERNQRIEDIMWRIYRNKREEALRLTPTDDIVKLYQYIQELADIPTQDGFPNNVIWPEEPR